MSDNILVPSDIFETNSGIKNDFDKIVQPKLISSSDTNVKYECDDSKQLKIVFKNISERDKNINQNLTEIVNCTLKNSQKELHQAIQESKIQEKPENLQSTNDNLIKSINKNFDSNASNTSDGKFENSTLEKSDNLPGIKKHFQERNLSHFQNENSAFASLKINMGNHISQNHSDIIIDNTENHVLNNEKSQNFDRINPISKNTDFIPNIVKNCPAVENADEDVIIVEGCDISQEKKNEERKCVQKNKVDLNLVKNILQKDDHVVIVEETEVKNFEEKQCEDKSENVQKTVNLVENCPDYEKNDENVVKTEGPELNSNKCAKELENSPKKENIVIIDSGSDEDNDDVVIIDQTKLNSQQYKEKHQNAPENKGNYLPTLSPSSSQTLAGFLNNNSTLSENKNIEHTQDVIVINDSPEKRIEAIKTKNENSNPTRPKKHLYFEMKNQEFVLVEDNSEISEKNNFLENRGSIFGNKYDILNSNTENQSRRCDFSFIFAYEELKNDKQVAKNEIIHENKGANNVEQVHLSEENNQPFLKTDLPTVESPKSIENNINPSENSIERSPTHSKKNDITHDINFSHEENLINESTENQIEDFNQNCEKNNQSFLKTDLPSIESPKSIENTIYPSENSIEQYPTNLKKNDSTHEKNFSHEESLKNEKSEKQIEDFNQNCEEIRRSSRETNPSKDVTVSTCEKNYESQESIEISIQSDELRLITDSKSEKSEDIIQNLKESEKINTDKAGYEKIDFSFISAYNNLQNNKNLIMEEAKLNRNNLEDKFSHESEQAQKSEEKLQNGSGKKRHEGIRPQGEENKSSETASVSRSEILEASKNIAHKLSTREETTKSDDKVGSFNNENEENTVARNKILQVSGETVSDIEDKLQTNEEPTIVNEKINYVNEKNKVSLDEKLGVGDETALDIAIGTKTSVETIFNDDKIWVDTRENEEKTKQSKTVCDSAFKVSSNSEESSRNSVEYNDETKKDNVNIIKISKNEDNQINEDVVNLIEEIDQLIDETENSIISDTISDEKIHIVLQTETQVEAVIGQKEIEDQHCQSIEIEKDISLKEALKNVDQVQNDVQDNPIEVIRVDKDKHDKMLETQAEAIIGQKEIEDQHCQSIEIEEDISLKEALKNVDQVQNDVQDNPIEVISVDEDKHNKILFPTQKDDSSNQEIVRTENLRIENNGKSSIQNDIQVLNENEGQIEAQNSLIDIEKCKNIQNNSVSSKTVQNESHNTKIEDQNRPAEARHGILCAENKVLNEKQTQFEPPNNLSEVKESYCVKNETLINEKDIQVQNELQSIQIEEPISSVEIENTEKLIQVQNEERRSLDGVQYDQTEALNDNLDSENKIQFLNDTEKQIVAQKNTIEGPKEQNLENLTESNEKHPISSIREKLLQSQKDFQKSKNVENEIDNEINEDFCKLEEVQNEKDNQNEKQATEMTDSCKPEVDRHCLTEAKNEIIISKNEFITQNNSNESQIIKNEALSSHNLIQSQIEVQNETMSSGNENQVRNEEMNSNTFQINQNRIVDQNIEPDVSKTDTLKEQQSPTNEKLSYRTKSYLFTDVGCSSDQPVANKSVNDTPDDQPSSDSIKPHGELIEESTSPNISDVLDQSSTIKDAIEVNETPDDQRSSESIKPHGELVEESTSPNISDVLYQSSTIKDVIESFVINAESREDQSKPSENSSNEVESVAVNDVIDGFDSNETKLQINYQIQLKTEKVITNSCELRTLLSVEADTEPDEKIINVESNTILEKEQNNAEIQRNLDMKTDNNVGQKTLQTITKEGQVLHDEIHIQNDTQEQTENNDNQNKEICELPNNQKLYPLKIYLPPQVDTELDHISPQESPNSPILAPLFKSYTPDDDLRNKLKMQLNLLRNVKRVTNKDENLLPTLNDIKPSKNSEQIEKPDLSDVLISNDSEHLIVSVVGGYVSDDDSNNTNFSENSTKEKLNNSNMSITDFLLKKNTSHEEKSPNKNSITPQKTKDITKIKGWRSKNFTLDENLEEVEQDHTEEIDTVEHSKEESKDLTQNFIHLDQPSTSKGVSVITETSEDGPSSEITEPVKKLPKTIKAAFVSDVLDSFLSNDAKLQISYEIPKLKAEEAITHPKELPILPVLESEKIETGKPVKKIEIGGYKPKTLAEKRKLLEMERKKKLSQSMLINENYIEKLKRAKSDQNVIDHFVKENFPFNKNTWNLATNNFPSQYALLNNKKIKIMGGYGKSFNIKNTYRKYNMKRYGPRFIENRKPGPLCFKLKQLNSQKRNYEYKVLKMPKIKLVIYPECGKKLPYIAEQYLSFCKDDTCISENFALFAVSALTTIKEPQRLEFELPYANKQNKILLKKVFVKEKIKKGIAIETKMSKVDRYPNATVDKEIKNIVSDMIDCIENQDLDKILIKDDPDFEPRNVKKEKPKDEVQEKQKFEDDVLQSAIIKQRNHKKNRTTLELRRLNIQIIEVDVEDSPKTDKTECSEEFCRLGCVCDSLLGVGNSIPDHCGRENCMFKCNCTDIPQQNKHSVKLPAGTDLLSASTMMRLKDDALKHLAKVEKEFAQTVIKANNQTIVVGGGSRERQKRVPKVPKKFDDYINTVDEIVKNQNDPPIENAEETIPEKKEEISSNNRKTLIPIWKTEKTFEEKLIEKARNSKCTVSLQKLDLSQILPYCMVHNLYKCYCGGVPDKQPEIRIPAPKNNDTDNLEYITYSSRSRKIVKEMAKEPKFCARTQIVERVNNDKDSQEKLIFDRNNRKPQTRNSKKRFSLDLEGNELLVPRQSTRIMRKKERISYVQDDPSEDIEDVPLKTRLRISEKTSRNDSPEVQPSKRRSLDSTKSTDELIPLRRSSREIKVTSKVDKNNPYFASKDKKIITYSAKPTLKNDNTTDTLRVRNDLMNSSSTSKITTDEMKSTIGFVEKPRTSLTSKDRVSSLIDYEKSYCGLIIPTDEWKITFQKMLKLAPSTFSCIRLIQWPMLVKRYQNKEIQIWISSKNIYSNIILTENNRRPSRFHLNINSLHEVIVDSSKVPNIVNCLINNKIPGNASKGNETYMILVNTGLDWEARGTILLNNIDNLIKERLNHRPTPKYILVDTFNDTQNPEMVMVYNENNLNSDFIDTDDTTESKKRKISDVQTEETYKKAKYNTNLPNKDRLPESDKNLPRDKLSLNDKISPNDKISLQKYEVTPKKEKQSSQFRPILPKNDTSSQHFLFLPQERKRIINTQNGDSNIVYSSNSMTIEKVKPEQPKIVEEPKIIPKNPEETQFTKILASLPTGTEQFHWFMLKLENDFSVLKITSTSFYIKYMHLISAVQMANKNQKTVRIRTLDKKNKHHISYGIYAVPDFNDRIFFGPYLNEKEHFLETFRYANGKLISTKAYNIMRGNPNKQMSGIWFTQKTDPKKVLIYDNKVKVDDQKTKKDDFVDLTENDSDDEKNKKKSNLLDPLFNILSANFTKQLANDVTIEKIPKATSPTKAPKSPEKVDLSISKQTTKNELDILTSVKTEIIAVKMDVSASSSIKKDVKSTKDNKLINNLDLLPEQSKGPRKRKLLDHLLPKSSAKQLPSLIPVTTLQTTKKQEKINLTEQSSTKMTSILKPVTVLYLTSNIPDLGFIDILYSDDSYQIPGIEMEESGTRKFTHVNDAIKWLSGYLKEHICHVPSELDLGLKVWKNKKAPDIPKFNDQCLNGLHLICSRGLFHIYQVKGELLKEKGFSDAEITDMLFYKFNILIQKNIRILGNILFDNDADGIEDYEILAMAPQKIRELTNQEENLVLQKKKLREEQKSKIIVLESLTNGLPEFEREKITKNLGIILSKQHPKFNISKKISVKNLSPNSNSDSGIKFKLMSNSNKTYFVPVNSEISNSTNLSIKSDPNYLSSDNSEVVDLTDS